MERKVNQELIEFNNSKKNKKYLETALGYAFVSCPDFSHQHGVYDFKSLQGGMPLTITLTRTLLAHLDKPVRLFLSDHEAYRPEVCERLKLSRDEMLSLIYQSYEVICGEFDSCNLLSQGYSYESVQEEKPLVPNDSHMLNALIYWSGEGFSRHQLEERYREKYAQMYAFLNFCKQEKLCPVLLYSKFNLNLVSVVRKRFESMPVIFLDVADPH